MGYSLRQVGIAVTVFYAVLLLFDARGLYNWTTKLGISEHTKKLRQVAEQHWRRTADFGLEEPKHTLEALFLDFQDAHPLLYPKKYPEFLARRRAREEKRSLLVVERSVQDVADALLSARREKRLKERAKNRAKRDDPRGPHVLLVGDSIMAGIGPILKKEVSSRLEGKAILKARVATGLARPDVFDWRRELEASLAEDDYDAVVLMMGTNDSQDIVEDGNILIYGTHEWVRAYNERVAQMMETACKGTPRALWIGLPPMRSQAFNRKIIRINTWAKRQARKHKCMEYLGLDNVIGDENGHFASYLKIADELEKVRMVDGIHVTARGGLVISDYLLPILTRKPDVSRLSH